MADNTQLSTNSGTGDVLATKEVSHGGDTTKLQAVSLMGVSGTEGAYTVADINGDATNGLDVDVTRSALPTGASTAANQTTIIGHLDGVEALLATIDADTSNLSVVGGGTEAAAMRVTIASDSTGVVSVDDNGGSLTVDGTVTANLGATDNAVLDSIQAAVEVIDNAISGSEMQVDVVAALPAGTNNIGDVDVLTISAGTNLVGDVGIQGRASGGTSTFRSIDLDETEEEVKATAGTIYSIAAFNTTAAPLYLKLYNLTAANTTVGTSTPTHTYVVPGNADSDGAGFVLSVPQGIAFGTAISAAVTTAVADADTGAPGANACIVNIQYV